MPENNNIWDKEIPPESSHYNWEDNPKAILGDHSLLASEKFKLVDLFCGCGGFSSGFEMAGFQSILGTDIHVPSIDTFRKNHPWADILLGDMRKVNDEMLSASLEGRNVDMIAAGVPCQGFSLNNRKRWENDNRNFLFREFIRVVKIASPRIVLLENVSGLASSADGAFKAAIAEAIGECGYEVSFMMLNALDYGIPQKRKRVFFLGAKPGIDIWWPTPTHGEGRLRKPVTVWEAIGDLPQIGPGEKADCYDKPPFSDFQVWARSGGNEILYNHEAPDHPQSTIDKIASTVPGKPMYPKFKQRIRLHPDLPSPTQVSGGIRPQFQFGHPQLSRGLTVRERCRIQSFRDDYFICGGTVMGRVQTGNAVPPLLAKAIAEQIARMLRGEKRPDSALSEPPSQMVLF